MRTHLALALALAVIAPGCLSDDAPAADALTPATTTPTGDPEPGGEPAPEPANVTTGAADGAFTVSMSAAACPPGAICLKYSEGEPGVLNLTGNTTNLTIEFTWQATTPVAATLDLRVWGPSEEVAGMEGTSPLTIAVPQALDAGEYALVGFPMSPAGALVQQEVTWRATWTSTTP